MTNEYIINDGTPPPDDAILDEIVFEDEHRITSEELRGTLSSRASKWDFSKQGLRGDIAKYKLQKQGEHHG